MEWVVTTGKTLDEARDSALDQLGVHGDDAEFEVLEEPRPGCSAASEASSVSVPGSARPPRAPRSSAVIARSGPARAETRARI